MNLALMVSSNQVLSLDQVKGDHELLTDIQTRLIGLRLLSQGDADGIYGPKTQAAIATFCQSVNLNNSTAGQFGPSFAKALIQTRSLGSVGGPSSTAPDSSAFATALSFTLPAEGGYVNNPADPGGATNMGIIQTVYDSYLSSKGLASRDVKNISKAEVTDIYYSRYWLPAHCDKVSLPLAVTLFDTCVNFGVGGGIEFLQDALGVGADGSWGPLTEQALRAGRDTLDTAIAIVNGRIAYRHLRVNQVPSQQQFLAGWLNRDNALMKFVNSLAVPAGNR